MNRIILIGNGFDLAQGLETGYKHFINHFWEEKTRLFLEKFRLHEMMHQGAVPHENYEDEDIAIVSSSFDDIVNGVPQIQITHFYDQHKHSLFSELCLNKHIDKIHFKNKFLKRITEKQQLQNWVDIEQEYYLALLQYMENKNIEEVLTLNKEFSALKAVLEEYLTSQKYIDKDKAYSIYEKIYYPLNRYREWLGKEEEKYDALLFLNFNYTNNIKLNYDLFKSSKLIHIHGELSNTGNPVIFGYGDDIDEKYKLIEQLNNNEYLKNMKSIKYSETRNYQEVLAFIEANEYEIFIMGHSCGISDRTLLNKLFEHNHCKRIKPFYHKKEDGTDNFTDLSINISRNFKDKSLFREKMVNKLDCEPLL